MEAAITLTFAQVLTIVSELGGRQTKEVRIASDIETLENIGTADVVLVTYDAGWGTLTLRVFPDGSSSQAGMGVNVEKIST